MHMLVDAVSFQVPLMFCLCVWWHVRTAHCMCNHYICVCVCVCKKLQSHRKQKLWMEDFSMVEISLRSVAL